MNLGRPLWIIALALGLMGCPEEPETGTSTTSTSLPDECATGGNNDYCCQFNENFCDTVGTSSSSTTATTFPDECGTGGEPDDYCCMFNPNFCDTTGGASSSTTGASTSTTTGG